ncbi:MULTISPECIES: diadenylate cyclase CdaA [Anaerococcus]|jgi:TIGR00159 family protein|uniref:Diadenylate cyclase n=1 Tax=Anaerococcus nagyae TaxID=1755241 RepID=A0A3E2TGF3_9FIRM|nr:MULTISPECIES: diadenylate cyclase CdaA [Anaerococcus]MBP2068871.1 diadenylate cyclase [Anaerococcus nagyae]MDU1828703.1 diadenylate cyclase CdaA [Anaerococcus sp.]MDU1865212.1 diadenylate cyclase CdaA [Anaerococcus sp.]MDU2352980.1 diadenylate cyclase CdaA [Anaerococcus sp.]MDU2566008.1 diadenylate cyclase CdaA [Anaerococcus sp.]
MNYITDFINSLALIRVTDIIDIAIIAFAVYKLFSLLRNTRAEQVLYGLIIVLLFASLADILNLNTVSWVMNQFLTVALVFIIVVFQPELRSALERIGRGRSIFTGERAVKSEKTIDELVRAMTSLSRQKIGALVVLEREVGLNDIVESGTTLGADVSSELLINIFIPNTPLHDGAVIISSDKIRAAACYLPLSNSNTISKELGTRHRAAVGISERSDCLVVVVSEETGNISVIESGRIDRYLDEDSFKQRLYNELVVKEVMKEEKEVSDEQ